MDRTSNGLRQGIPWGGILVGLWIGGGLLLGIGGNQRVSAQSAPPDSQQQRPPEIERVRQRIQDIRQTPTEWRRRLGERLSPKISPFQPSSPEPSPQLSTQFRQEDGPTWADLRQVERRLQEVIRRLLVEQYGTEFPAREMARRLRFQPRDTVRVATPIRDTIALSDSIAGSDSVFVSDSVRIVRDTIREIRVEQVERRLLDEGVFRAFEVNFAFGESTLQPRATRTLDVVGAVLQRHPRLRIEIAGHTDARGGDAFNQRLSEVRADAVRTYLLSRFGLSAERLEARGYGESQPIASNDARAGRSLNRRVEFRVLNPGAMP